MIKPPTKTATVIDHAETAKLARAIRKKRGVSLRAVARHLGISAPYLSDLELGRRNWNEGLFCAFQKAVNKQGERL